jgi:hypothetical protein
MIQEPAGKLQLGKGLTFRNFFTSHSFTFATCVTNIWNEWIQPVSRFSDCDILALVKSKRSSIIVSYLIIFLANTTTNKAMKKAPVSASADAKI